MEEDKAPWVNFRMYASGSKKTVNCWAQDESDAINEILEGEYLDEDGGPMIFTLTDF